MNKHREIVGREKEIARYKNQLIEQIVAAIKPRRKSKTEKKGVFKLPMPSHDKVISDKNIDIKTYGAIMLNSNWGGKIANAKERYIYNETIENQIKEICSECNISKKTFKRHLSKLRKCNINILEAISVKGELAYKLNYACDSGTNFITIDNIALRKLCNAYSENVLRLYIIFNYMCIEVLKNTEDKKYVVNRIEKHLTQEWLCKKIGISYNNRIVITDCVESLANGGFIKVRTDYKYNTIDKDGDVNIYKVPFYYYSLSDDYLKNTRN